MLESGITIALLRQQVLAQLPLEVVLSCATTSERHKPQHGLYRLADGRVVIGERQTSDSPSVDLRVDTARELVRLAVRRWYSGLPEGQLMEAYQCPNRYGHFAFCDTSTEAVSLAPDERDELAEAVIAAFMAQWLRMRETIQIRIEEKVPVDSSQKFLPIVEISDEFIRSCRARLKDNIILEIAYLLSEAEAWCGDQRIQAINAAR